MRAEDFRAFIVMLFFGIVGVLLNNYGYITAATVSFIILICLVVMFLYKIYRRDIKKDYFSRYDVIEVPEETKPMGEQGVERIPEEQISEESTVD
jgi:uncharacterized membrane protein